LSLLLLVVAACTIREEEEENISTILACIGGSIGVHNTPSGHWLRS
jgi:hypothetical protein